MKGPILIGASIPWDEPQPMTKRQKAHQRKWLKEEHYFRDPKEMSNGSLLKVCCRQAYRGLCIECPALVRCKFGTEVQDRIDDGRLPDDELKRLRSSR